jgi:glycosyltransferase involved in cell wall biosynthesis
MPRILHIIDSLGRTGTANQLLLLARGLTREGFDVHVCALDQRAPMLPEFAAAEIPVTIIGRRWVLDPLADWRVRQLVASLRPEIVHTWDTVAGMFGPIAVRSDAKPRLIAGHYGVRTYQPAWNSFVEKRFAKHVDRFVAGSPVVRGWCVSRGLPAEKFVVIPPGAAPTQGSDVSREDLLRELLLPKDAKLIGIIGRLVPERRVRDLIWAADLLRVLHDNLRVLIIGDGPERAQLERYARLASDLDHIRFLGERGDVWRIMPHLDVLWNGSENTVPSISILEAMAAGVPVIASDVEVNRELVVDSETGYLIPIGSRSGRAARARHTDRIFSDRELAAKLTAATQDRAVRCFSAELSIQRYVELYV